METPLAFRRRKKFGEDYGHLEEVLYSALVIAVFSLFVVLAKHYFRVPLHIPGHSAIYVVPLMLMGRIASRNRLGGTGIGGLSGVMMAFLGLGGGFLLGIPRYLFMGAVIDILLWNPSVQGSAIYLIAAGAFANFAKFFVGLVIASSVGIPVFFIHLGLTYGAITHLTFGAIGGLIGFCVVKTIRRVKGHSLTG